MAAFVIYVRTQRRRRMARGSAKDTVKSAETTPTSSLSPPRNAGSPQSSTPRDNTIPRDPPSLSTRQPSTPSRSVYGEVADIEINSQHRLADLLDQPRRLALVLLRLCAERHLLALDIYDELVRVGYPFVMPSTTPSATPTPTLSSSTSESTDVTAVTPQPQPQPHPPNTAKNCEGWGWEEVFTSIVQLCIHTSQFAKAAGVLERFRADPSLRPTLHFYASIMNAYAAKQRYEQAVGLYEFVLADGLQPDTVMLSCLINLAADLSWNEKAIFFFERLKEIGTPSVKAYMTLVRIYGRIGDYQAAMDTLNAMVASGVEPDTLLINQVLLGCVNGGRVDIAEDIIQGTLIHSRRELLDIVSVNTLLKGYTHANLFDKAMEAFNCLLGGELQLAPNDISFNTLIDAAIRTQRQDSAWELLSMMEAAGVQPDFCTVSTLIKGIVNLPPVPLPSAHAPFGFQGSMRQHPDTEAALLHRQRHIDRVLLLLAKLSAREPPVSFVADGKRTAGKFREAVFDSMLDACVAMRDLDTLQRTFKLMKANGVTPSAVTYGTLINAFGQCGQLPACFELWDEMQRDGLQPTSVTYGCLIDACINQNDLHTAHRLFQEIQQHPPPLHQHQQQQQQQQTASGGEQECGRQGNTMLYTTLIKGFAKSRQTDRAMEVYESMKREGVPRNSVTTNDGRLNDVLQDMVACKIEPDLITYSILIKGNCENGKLDRAVELLYSMKAKGFVPDEIVYNSLLKGCSHAGDVALAEKLLEDLARDEIRPSNVTFSILVKMYGRLRLVEEAFQTVQEMREVYQLQPGVFVYTTLIQACVRSTHFKRAFEVFQEMQMTGVEPDAVTLGALLLGCVHAGRLEVATQIVQMAYGLRSHVELQSAGYDLPPLRLIPPPHKPVIPWLPLQPEVINNIIASCQRNCRHDLADELVKVWQEHGTHTGDDWRCGARGGRGGGGIKRYGVHNRV
ncbi:unnamed protein product [Vitrella brassicaformis CCMP3155]|uniref:Pentacotripeptide-repeat region of PRORP domain-containing protein n=1 Tax=Vitrella brassicaformis (strain CCMP3155) TaxID=1169540 RepID=A0A0G4EKK7_VITBC|nr:unnamed protein product [Vitrella brassicaformis CCMP3155]|eukprot:CEL97092.1 unnamed protein product [Vitrella brassicaformis CCMP3155]